MAINSLIQLRKGTSSEWIATNPVLASGEPGYDVTNKVLKIGDGTTPWNTLDNHKHISSDITNFNNAVSGLLPTIANSGNNRVLLSSGSPYGISATNYTFPTSDGTSGQTLVTNGSGIVSWSTINSNSNSNSNLIRGSFALANNSGVFSVPNGYNIGTLDVYYNGIKLLAGTDYTANNGSNFTLTNTAVSGDIIEYVALNAQTSAIGNTALGSITTTSSQSVFNVQNGYVPGSIAVFVNGSKLVDGIEFTATNGLSFTLTFPVASGTTVDYIAYGAVVASTNLQKTGDTMTGNLIIGNNSDLIVEGDLTLNRYKEVYTNIGNTGTSKIINLTSGTMQAFTLTGNCIFTMPTIEAGRSFTVLLRTGAGNFTATFTGVRWPNNITPTITTAANRLDLATFTSDGTYWYGNISQNYTV